MINKLELKKQLKEMGIKIEGNYVRRKDLKKILSEEEYKKYKQVVNSINKDILTEMVYGIEETYLSHLTKYGVSSVSIDYGDMKEKVVPITMTLKFDNLKEKNKKSFDQHIDLGALEAGEDFLEAFCGMDQNEIKLLNEAIDAGDDISDIEPVLWNYLGQEYALRTLPNETDGGEWLDSDEKHIVELFKLVVL